MASILRHSAGHMWTDQAQCILHLFNRTCRVLSRKNGPSSFKSEAAVRNTAAAAAARQERRRTVTHAAAQQQSPSVQFNGDIEPQQLLAALTSTKSYTQLAAFVQSQSDVFLHSPLCVYALLHAVQLRDTLSDEQLGKGSLATEHKVLQQMAMVEELLDTLCDAAEQQVAQLPLPTQATLALALAQLDYYHAPTYSAIAAAVLQELADKQPIDVASETQQQQQQEQRASSTNGSSTAGASGDDSSSSSKESVPARATALCELPASLVPGVLLSLSVTYSLNGHHDAALLDELADQAVAFRLTFPDASPLISMAAALLDLQHYCPGLVAAAAAAALAQMAAADAQPGEGSSLGPEEVVSLLLALAFFRLEAPQFVQEALEAFAGDPELLLALDQVQLARLWKALLLLSSQGVTPPQELLQVFGFIQSEEPDLLLLGSCRAAVDLADLEAVQAADDSILQEWQDAGLLAPAQMLAALQNMGHQLERRVQVSAAGLAAAAAQEQDQQGAREREELGGVTAVVDVCLRLPDKRLVAVLPLDESRYCHSPPSRLRGAAAVDVLVLQALGLSVLPLPVAEWQALAGDVARQQRYLQARLAAATATS